MVSFGQRKGQRPESLPGLYAEPGVGRGRPSGHRAGHMDADARVFRHPGLTLHLGTQEDAPPTVRHRGPDRPSGPPHLAPPLRAHPTATCSRPAWPAAEPAATDLTRPPSSPPTKDLRTRQWNPAPTQATNGSNSQLKIKGHVSELRGPAQEVARQILRQGPGIRTLAHCSACPPPPGWSGSGPKPAVHEVYR